VADTPDAGSVWLYSDDLVFSERIASIVTPRSIPFRRIAEKDLADLSTRRGLLILDLDKGMVPLARAIDVARTAGPGTWHICGYGSHIDANGLRALRDAGADRVTSRARLIQTLELIIAEELAW
jgi:hypothetical protein